LSRERYACGMRFDATLAVRPQSDGALALVVRHAHELAIDAEPCTLTFSLWDEPGDTVRASLRHPGSGAVALVQGNRALIALGHAVRLCLRESELDEKP
jgi:hypothetical protein